MDEKSNGREEEEGRRLKGLEKAKDFSGGRNESLGEKEWKVWF